jgi:signal transduction histidine kinase
MSSDGVVEAPLGGTIAELRGTEPQTPAGNPLYGHAFLSTVGATKNDRRLATGVMVLSILTFAAAIPFVRVHLPPVPAFIPGYESALLICDAITAVMLFGQFCQTRSAALLALAAGYLFDALLIIPHALTFPGVFAPTGLLGAGTQSTAWLYQFWHGGFPLFVIGFAWLEAHRPEPMTRAAMRRALGIAIVGVAVLAGALTMLATLGEDLLPVMIQGADYSRAVTSGIGPTVWAASIAALVALWYWRQPTVLHTWLTVVMCAWVCDVGLSAVFGSARYDLGFYTGRVYGLMAASFVLFVLLIEAGGLHSRLAAAKALLDKYALGLEGRVREGTAELARANETLLTEAGERQKAEAQLRQAQKMEALGQLTGGLAHDFNNHLGIIIGNLDLLGETLAGDPEQKELIDDALAAAFNGADLTRRLLAFARKQPLRPARVDTNQLIGEITKLLRRTLGERIEITLNFDATIPPILVDPAQLESAIANLANNARDAMPGGGQLTITTGVRYLDQDYAAEHAEVTPGAYVMIDVSDTGCGMAPETLAKVFEPFFTTKEPGRGTGLGLSMVFGFLKQSGGHINVYSELGKGTTFRLYLRPDASAADALEQPASGAEEPVGTGEHILVVEDNVKLRAVLVKQLADLRYRVCEASSADAALKLIDGGEAIDLLLTDIVMPGKLDGCALAREFVARRPGGRVLLTSGFPSSRLSEIEGLGASLRLLDKPYRKQDLARALRETLADAPPAALQVSLTQC